MSRQILHGTEARQALLRGVEALTNAVKVTLGPRGRNVVIDTLHGDPEITKDGVTVAKSIILSDPLANVGAKAVRNVAAATAEEAGDGTTTATVLAHAIFAEGVKRVEAGANPMGLLRGINYGVDLAVAAIAAHSSPVQGFEAMQQVARISANGDEFVGDLVAQAVQAVGQHGVVALDDAPGIETLLEKRVGYQFDSGFIRWEFVTDPNRMECVLENPYILVSEKQLVSMQDIMGIANLVAAEQRSLLIVAAEVDGEALATLIHNRLRGVLQVAAVKAPGHQHRRDAMLQDLGIATGAKVHTVRDGRRLDGYTLADLGQAARAVVSADRTIILDARGDQERVQARVKELRDQHDLTENAYDKEQLNQRAARMNGAAAVLRVGAKTDTERGERKARVEDAVCATRAALEEGVVPGGGLTLFFASEVLGPPPEDESERDGYRILKGALEEPLRVIARNAGENPEAVVARVRTGLDGYNAATRTYEDLRAAGVLDPAKVVRVALQNAASIASLLLTSECMVVPVPEPVALQRPGYPQLPQQ